MLKVFDHTKSGLWAALLNWWNVRKTPAAALWTTSQRTKIESPLDSGETKYPCLDREVVGEEKDIHNQW